MEFMFRISIALGSTFILLIVTLPGVLKLPTDTNIPSGYSGLEEVPSNFMAKSKQIDWLVSIYDLVDSVSSSPDDMDCCSRNRSLQ